MTKNEMKCPCFMHTSNGTGKYYITCKDGERSARQTFKSTDARKSHVEKNCMRFANGCKLFRPTVLTAESPYEACPAVDEQDYSSDSVEIPSTIAPDDADDGFETAAITTQDFDYSILDQETAAFVMTATASIMRIRSATVMAIGRELAPVREKLANRRNGTWQQWCRSIGMSDDTATRYIRAYEWIMSNNVDVQIADNIPSGLLFEASKPSAPKELQEQVLAGDVTTRAEYIQLAEELKAAEEAKKRLAEVAADNRRRAEANEHDLSMERQRLAERERQLLQLQRQVDTLQAQAKDNGETEALRNRLADAQAKLTATRQELVSLQTRTPLEVAAVATKEVLSEEDAERIRLLEQENQALKERAIINKESLESIRIVKTNISKTVSLCLPIFLAEAAAHTDDADPVRVAMKDLINEVALIHDEFTKILNQAT